MFIKKLESCKELIAGDGSILREFLHPDKADLALRYSFAHAIVKPGQVTKPHKLKTSEVYYILDGQGTMHIDEETAEVHVGDCIYIPPNSKQHIANPGNSDLIFLCIVDPAWQPANEEIL